MKANHLINVTKWTREKQPNPRIINLHNFCISSQNVKKKKNVPVDQNWFSKKFSRTLEISKNTDFEDFDQNVRIGKKSKIGQIARMEIFLTIQIDKNVQNLHSKIVKNDLTHKNGSN